MELNSMYFSKEQVEAGEMIEFLNILLKQSYGVSKYYNDIHIKPDDCGAFVIEWVNVPWSHDWGGRFEYLDDDQYSMTEYCFPDRHYELLRDKEEYDERLKEFLKENPGWEMTDYGTWVNTIENEKWLEQEYQPEKDFVEKSKTTFSEEVK